MLTDSMRRLSGLITACWVLFGLGRLPQAASCPLPPDSFVDTNTFKLAFASQNTPYDEDLRWRSNPKRQSGPALACWKLAELQAHQGFPSAFWDNRASSTTPPQPNNSCDWPAGHWGRAAYWLTPAELDGERDNCAGLRRSLLTQCLELVISEPVACTVEEGGKSPLDGNLTSLLETLCRDEKVVVPACSALLAMLKPKPSGYVETPQRRRARLILSGVSFGLGAVALALGVTQMFIPLGTSGSCPQSGIDYPCGPDRYGLGIPLAVGGGLLVAAGGALLAVKF
jgi:hypothetical protein